MEPVQLAGWGFFPLDEQLELAGGSLTPTAEEHLVRLGTWMPFERAAQMLHALTGVWVTEATARRHTEQIGQIIQALQDEKGQQGAPPVVQAPEQLVLSADGAYVPLQQGVWAEVKTLAIGEVDHKAGQAHTSHLSYFSRMSNATTFLDRCEGEMQHRAVVQAAEVALVVDGAEWLQTMADVHRPDAVRILDFAHAAQRVNAILENVSQAGHPLPLDARSRSLHLLKHRGPRPVLRWLRWLTRSVLSVGTIAEDLAYLHKRETCLHYPAYQAAGWPIGSGMVESANKLVMQTRLKGPGMHWGPDHVNPMLALRTTVCNDRWIQSWQEASSARMQQRQQRRMVRVQQRQQEATQRFLLAWMRFVSPPSPPPAPQPSRHQAQSPTIVAGRPTARHPWRRPWKARSASLVSAKN